MEKRLGIAALLFVMLALIVFFAIESILAFPGVVNSTAFNVTSNDDLNLTSGAKCQPSCARFIPPKNVLVGAVGNNSNITGWETWKKTDITGWKIVNMSNFAYVNNFESTRYDQGFLNLTTRTDDTSGTIWTSVLSTTNYSMPSSGIIVDFWIKQIGAAGNTWHPAFCFDFTFDKVVNGTTFVECNMPNSGAGVVGVYYEPATGRYNLFKKNNGASENINSVIRTSGFDWEHWTVWINKTHAAAAINLTEGGAAVIALTEHAVAANGGGSGSPSFDIYHGIVPDYRGVLYANISIYNASQWGQPSNLTPAVLETIMANSTANVSLVKISNQSLYYAAGSSATYQIFNDSYGKTQSVTEGTYNSLWSIGTGMNVTLIPPSLYVASEFTSFLLEWDVPNILPTVNASYNITSVNSSDDIGTVLNYSDTDGGVWSSNETYWFKNGEVITSAANATFLHSGNLTYPDIINFSARVSDAKNWSDFSTNVSLVINDTISPTFANTSANQSSIVTDTLFNLSVIISCTGSNCSSITAEIENPNLIRQNVTLSNISLNAAKQDVLFNGSYTPGLPTGTWFVRLFATDFAGNVNTTIDRFYQFSVTAAPSGDGDGGDGGGGGGGQTPATSERKLSLLSPLGSGEVTLVLFSGRVTEQKYEVINSGNQSFQVTLSCVDVSTSVCQYISLNQTLVTLGAGQKIESFFSVSVPEDAQFASGLIHIKGVAASREAILKVNVAKRSRLFGIITTSIARLFLLSFSVGNATVPVPPVLLFFVLPEFLMLMLLGRARIRFKPLFLLLMIVFVFMLGVALLAVLAGGK